MRLSYLYKQSEYFYYYFGIGCVIVSVQVRTDIETGQYRRLNTKFH